MDFEEVFEKSHDVESFLKNVRTYLAERPELTSKERTSHYWALHYRWREKVVEGKKKPS